MACKISWTDRAWRTYESNIKYLEEEWTQREISKFILLVDKKLLNLSNHPKIGSVRNKKRSEIRHT